MLRESTIKDVFELYIKRCVRAHCSETTIKHHKNNMHIFELFINLDKPISIVDNDLIIDFVFFLENKRKPDGTPLRQRTKFTYIKGLETVFSWAADLKYIKRVTFPDCKIGEPLIRTYDKIQIEKLVFVPSGSEFNEIRNWTVVNFLLETGIVLGTLLELKLTDLDLEEKKFNIRHIYNRRGTELPLSSRLIEILKQYIKFRAAVPGEHLFCLKTGGKMRARGMQQAITSYNQARNVELSSIHGFRYTFAHIGFMAGVNIPMLHRLMLHEELIHVDKKSSPSLDELRKERDKFTIAS